jgi:hypothetical protein
MFWASVSACKVFMVKSSEIDPVDEMKWSQKNRMGGRGLSC